MRGNCCIDHSRFKIYEFTTLYCFHKQNCVVGYQADRDCDEKQDDHAWSPMQGLTNQVHPSRAENVRLLVTVDSMCSNIVFKIISLVPII